MIKVIVTTVVAIANYASGPQNMNARNAIKDFILNLLNALLPAPPSTSTSMTSISYAHSTARQI
jgi:hypothetical protein